MNSGAFSTLKRLAVLMPFTSLSTLAILIRLRVAAPTASHTADSLWQSMHSRL